LSNCWKVKRQFVVCPSIRLAENFLLHPSKRRFVRETVSVYKTAVAPGILFVKCRLASPALLK
jgi:hypothetical protein